MCVIVTSFSLNVSLISLVKESNQIIFATRDRRGRDGMVVGFITTYAISAYHHISCEFEPRSWRGVLDTTLCDKICL